MDNSLDPPEHARDVRDYWAYEREQMKRQAGRVSKKQETSKEWKGKMVGAMMEQNTKEKEWQKDIKWSSFEAITVFGFCRDYFWDMVY